MGELVLPSDVAVAVRTSSTLDRLGTVRSFNGYSRSEAVIILTDDSGDPAQLWVSPKLKGYRKAWASAADSKLVDPLEDWGDNTDLDHLFPKSWAAAKGSVMSHVRLFPVWAEVNRSAGACAGSTTGAVRRFTAS